MGNQFGVDGSGMWLHLVAIESRTRARSEIVGHLRMAIVPATLGVLIAVPLVAIVRRDVAWSPVALGIALSAMVGAMALASYLSAAKPYAMPQSRGSMFASSAPQHKGRAALVSLGSLIGSLLFALPAAAFLWPVLAGAPAWGFAALIIGPSVAALVGTVLVRRAAQVYFDSGPEIFNAVRIGDRS